MSVKSKIKNCVACAKGKQSHLQFKSKDNGLSKNLLDLIHSDLMGPMETKSIGQNHSKKVFVYLLKQKTEAIEKFSEFLNIVETQTGSKVKMLWHKSHQTTLIESKVE
jgi:hypothetical protein